MSVSPEALFDLVYGYYPRGMWDSEPGYAETEENRRLVEARRRAGRDNAAWRGLLERLARRLPDLPIQDGSLHLPAGSMDACYSALVRLPPQGDEQDRALGMLVSFIAPHYLVYGASTVAGPAGTDSPPPADEIEYGSDYLIVHKTPERSDSPVVRREIRYVLRAGEVRPARVIVEEIEAAFPGWSALVPEIGLLSVPDVVAGNRCLGEATLFDCLFTDNR